MRAIRAIRSVVAVVVLSLATAAAALLVWFGWKWGAHYAGVWWRGVRARLEAGDTTINQASWWMRDRWTTLRGMWDGPKLDADSLPEILTVIGAAGAAVLILRLPGAILAGWLGRRAIRRDAILCDPALGRRLGRRVYLDGALRWSVPLGIIWGAGVAFANHLWFFSEYLQTPPSRVVAMALPVIVVPMLDVPLSLRWARHLITKDIRGRQRMCPWCGYDVTSVGEGVCPECGHRVTRKARDEGVRVVRPYALRVGAAASAAILIIGAVLAWAVANLKGVNVNREARRLRDAVLMQRSESQLRVFLPADRVMVIEDRGVRMLLRVTPNPPDPSAPHEPWRIYKQASARVVVQQAQTEVLKRRREIEHIPGLLGPSPWATGPTPRVDATGDPAEDRAGVWITLPRSVHRAQLIEPDGRDPDVLWLMEGE